MVALTKDYDAEILTRVILPESPTMSPEAAREVLKLKFTATDQQRMTDLAAKARAGTLSVEEQCEAAGFERVSSLLGLLKSKARRSLHDGSE
jgi:hypothetical protein